jgi:hypothetical protein
MSSSCLPSFHPSCLPAFLLSFLFPSYLSSFIVPPSFLPSFLTTLTLNTLNTGLLLTDKTLNTYCCWLPFLLIGVMAAVSVSSDKETKQRYRASMADFIEAAKGDRGHTISDSLRLLMYGLTKQVKLGDCPSESEVEQLMESGKLTMQGKEKTQKAKLKAWRSQKGLSSKGAMDMYIQKCEEMGIIESTNVAGSNEGNTAAPEAGDRLLTATPPPQGSTTIESKEAERAAPTSVPVKDLETEFRRIVEMYHVDEIMNAWRMLQNLKRELNEPDADEDSVARVTQLMKEHAPLFATMEERNGLFKKSLKEFNTNEGWTFGQSSVLTDSEVWFRIEEDDGSLSLKVDGTVNGCTMLECIAVWREVDLYNEWMPMCSEAKKLAQYGKSELIAWQKTGVMPLVRDMVVHAFGDVSMDPTADDPCFLICGRSVTQDEYPNVEIPKLAGWGVDRTEMRFLNVLVQPISAESTRNCIITNMDLKTHLPQSVMNFILKKMVGVFLYSMEKCAHKIRQNPESSKHGKRMVENADFYTDFLQPKVDMCLNKAKEVIAKQEEETFKNAEEGKDVTTALRVLDDDESGWGLTNEATKKCGGEVFRFIDTGRRPSTIAVLMGWWGSSDSHMKKYSSIYTSVGISTVRFTAGTSSILNPAKLAKELLSFLHRQGLADREIIFHMWSNGGTLIYCRILDHLKADTTIKGMVLDAIFTWSWLSLSMTCFCLQSVPQSSTAVLVP